MVNVTKKNFLEVSCACYQTFVSFSWCFCSLSSSSCATKNTNTCYPTFELWHAFCFYVVYLFFFALQQSNDLLEYLPSAAFVAIDEEMTGISLPGWKRPKKDDTPAERYNSLKKVPERYTIIQVGISLFHANPMYDKNLEPELNFEPEFFVVSVCIILFDFLFESIDPPEFISNRIRFLCNE
jgi:hypothetical protein